MEAELVAKKKAPTDKEDTRFTYQFSSNGTRYHLRVPVAGQLGEERARELASRLVRAHNLPCYLEDELCSQLEVFARDSTLRQWDLEGDKALELAGDSVMKEDSKVVQRINQCAEQFTKNCLKFSVATVTPDPDSLLFSDMYHTLIHSPSLETLLQLEHTYALAMENSLQAWKNAREMMLKRHEAELKEKMGLVSSSKATEDDLAVMVREHERDRTVLEVQWGGELRKLRETQRNSYQQWIDGAYKELTSPDEGKNAQPSMFKRVDSDGGDDVFSGAGEGKGESHHTTLEESFTIHLGAQLKSTHNIRLLCGNPLTLCRQGTAGLRGGVMANPERLQTAMSLYSTKLSCMILTVDRGLGRQNGIEHKFGEICHQTTDFHFPDYSEQLSAVMECAVQANERRGQQQQGAGLDSSCSSQTSDPATPRGGSPFNNERAPVSGTDSYLSGHQYLSPPPVTNPLGGGARHGLGGSGREGGRGEGDPSDLDTQSVMLESGDFFITRHSNLSQVHMVLHLATDRESLKAPGLVPIPVFHGLRARHPVMIGLKKCLHIAARNDVHHITLPLLLVHNMEPEMTIQWCLKRAELVFKCVKGFMLENPLWGDGDSRTIQFLIPQNMSHDVFEEFCDMIPKIFRVSTTRKLTKTRTHSYK